MKINKNKLLIITLAVLGTLAVILMIFNDPGRKNTPAPYKIGEQVQKEKDQIDEVSDDKPVTEPVKLINPISPRIKPEFFEKYPWWDKLPIETEEYSIYYILPKESFRIRLKISKDSPQELIDDLTNKALEEIKKIYEKEPIPYYVVYLD